MNKLYIADLRREWMGNPYITFWRADNSGYAYPLSWSGKYDPETVAAGGSYYTTKHGRSLTRFAVPCPVADRLSVAPRPGTIDNDAGPVIENTPKNRRKLRRAATNAAAVTAR